MASTHSSTSPPSFFCLPLAIRQNIYAYLLAPHPDEDVTTINYTLRWNWLQSPSNTTFAGPTQIDLCRCPRQHIRSHNTPTSDHIYTRYQCQGPTVRFHSAREDLWLPNDELYARSGQINFLRPATEEELERRPHGNVLRTCRRLYEEAVPLLYRRRIFLLVTGPCPRGRYQAYATQRFLERLTPHARACVESISIIAHRYEEDCRVVDVGRAYGDLARYIGQSLPRFRDLCFGLWDERLKDLVRMFGGLVGKKGVSIWLCLRLDGGKVLVCENVAGLEEAVKDVVVLRGGDGGEIRKELGHHGSGDGADDRKELEHDESDTDDERTSEKRDGERTGLLRMKTRWEEVDTEESEPNYEHLISVLTPSMPREVTTEAPSKSKGEEKESIQDVEDDDEWIDATLSPGSAGVGKDGETEHWEMV